MANAAQRVEVLYEIPTTDPSWILLDDENVPDSVQQNEVNRELIDVLATWLAARGGGGRVGGNIALRWDERHPQVGVDPDVYLVEPDLPEGVRAKSLCTWKPGHHAPRLCIEVVSERTADRDYGDRPDRYAACGVRELWVFDPNRLGRGPRGGPFLLQRWRRDAQGRFRRVYAGDGPFHSDELDAWAVAVDGASRLRIADDPAGAHRWPTAAEKERAEKERERAEKEALREQVRALQAELARLR